MIDWLPLLCGIALLFLGRTLFWVTLAAIGAVIGWDIGLQWLAGKPWWVELLAALGGAGVGILVALCFQPLAAALIGFVAGGAAACEIALRLGLIATSGTDVGTLFTPPQAWHFPASPHEWHRFVPHIAPSLPFLAGGVIGAILALVFFEWGLIVLSSLYGAAIIVRSCGVPEVAGGTGRTGLIVFAVLAATGIVVQAWHRSGKAQRK